VLLHGLLLLGGCDRTSTDRHGEGEHDHEGQAGAEPHHEEHAEGVVHLSPAKLARAGIGTAAVESRPLAPELDTTGEVDYEQDRIGHVSPRIPGRVHRVPAKLGDRVTAGQVLAVIDSIELGQAKAAYLVARASEEVARENHEREQRLHDARISSEKEMLEARAAFVEAAASRESAHETLHLYGLSDAEIATLRTGAPESSLLTVRAPFAGQVVEKHVTVGELVTPEHNLFTIADLARVWIWIDVYERDLAAVHLGDGVVLEVTPYPGRTFSGTVTYISPRVADDTRTIRARIEVANDDGLLRPGMFARVKLTDPHAAGGSLAVVVPASAVVRDGDESVVFVSEGDGRFRRRPIDAGRRQADWIEVRSGVEPGERVVIAGVFLLKSELSREELGGGHEH
jgi:cobalt-zinc-cadmium efflux system membrane fusion protein